MNAGGDIKVEGSAASASASGGVGKLVSAETSVKIGAIEIKDGSLDINIVNVENNVGMGVEKKVGDEKASEKVSADPGSVGIGAKLGAFGVAVKVNLGKAADAVGDWFGAVGSYLNAVGEEANNTFFGSHGKSQ